MKRSRLPDPWTVSAEINGVVVCVDVDEGLVVAQQQQLLLMESMKMQVPILSDVDNALVLEVCVAVGSTVSAGDPLVRLAPAG